MQETASDNLQTLATSLCAVAREAGVVLMGEFGKSDLGAQTKADGSPVLRADLASHALLSQQIKELGIAVLSEEDAPDTFPSVEDSPFCIIDPLDGTKEFMRGSPDFAINIAYVEGLQPVIGIIYGPASQILHYGIRGVGAWRQDKAGTIEPIQVSDRTHDRVGTTSINHVAPADTELLTALGCTSTKPRGSALKFCDVADGTADIYARRGRTMVWDTAAADCLLKAAGGHMYYLGGNDVDESFRPRMDNAGFVCTNKPLSTAEHQVVERIFLAS